MLSTLFPFIFVFQNLDVAYYFVVGHIDLFLMLFYSYLPCLLAKIVLLITAKNDFLASNSCPNTRRTLVITLNLCTKYKNFLLE